MFSPLDPRLANRLIVRTATHGDCPLRTNAKNESGYDRVGKNGKKWRAWQIINGKQVFLKPSQDTPQEAALQLYLHEHPDPSMRSPSPGHRHKAKRAPHPSHICPPLTYIADTAIQTPFAGLKMVKVAGSPLKFANTNSPTKKENMLPLPNFAPMPLLANDSPGDYITIKGNKRVAVCHAASLTVPLPGVLWLAASPFT